MPRTLLRSAGLLAGLVIASPMTAQPSAATAATADAAASPARRAASAFELTIANMMQGPEVYGREPQNVRWTPDAAWLYFNWLPPGTDWRESPKPYRVRPVAGARPELVTGAHMDSVGPLLASGRTSRDGRQRVVEFQGDLWIVPAGATAARRLTQTTETERSPSFSGDGRTVFYIRGDNAFQLDLATGFIRQLTDVRTGTEPRGPAAGTPQREALRRQQRELFDVIRDAAGRDSVQRAERLQRDSTRIRPLYLRTGERLTQVDVSPGGDALIFLTSSAARDTEVSLIPEFVTESGYTEGRQMRTKVGDAQSSGRAGIMRLPSGEVSWLAVLPNDTTRAASTIALGGWSPRGDAALVFAVTPDFKTRYLHAVDTRGVVRTLDTLIDTAWVAGPCFTCMGWTPDGSRAWFVSEASGYAHLYSVAAGGGDRRALTSGDWEVLSAELSPDGREFLLHTSEVSPYERHFYRMPVGGGTRTRLTTREGGHDVALAPNGRLAASVYSYANRPPELFVMPARAGGEMAQLTNSPTADWLSYPWIAPEIVEIPASDGVGVPARIYRPSDFGVEPNGAAVIFVHGAGYLHNVHNYWSSYAREYMFNHLLASRGYVVLDIDYRASAGYGRDWRTAIYRHMGGRDLADHVDGSKYLQEAHGIDPERIGIYGGSYGGFITLMALFNAPEHFGAGAALRSVTDWAHYNHGYTGRILNFPDADTLAYRRSSPIYFAEGLEDPLLIAHGMVDVNVHFQDVVRLSQRLIELGKTDWEMALYPVEDHAFVRPSSWTDEYRRILELFDRHLVERPAAGAR